VARAGDVDEFDDDEALSWAGDEEQGRAAPRLRDLDAPAEVSVAEAAEEAPGSTGRRVTTVAFVVPYLAITIGWVFAVQLDPGPTELGPSILWQFGEFLAMLSAPLWFGAILALTRDRRPLVRVGWLALGLGVLVPWPLILQFLAALQFAGSLA
jgi:hypothetical protein